MNNNNARQGFTLIEILLVIALISIIGAPTAVFYTRFIHQQAVRDASSLIKGKLIEARVSAMAGKARCSWGIKYQSHKLTLFCGDSFSERDPNHDARFALNSNLKISGFDEIVFSFPSGRPNVSFSNAIISWGNNQEVFSINAEGSIQ